MAHAPQTIPAPERLLQAALEIIDEVGLARTTTRRIADRAGLNVQLIQYYFGGKDGLVEAAERYIVERFFAVLVPAVTTASSLADAIRVGVAETWSLARSDPAIVQPDLLLQSVRTGQEDADPGRPRHAQTHVATMLATVMARTGETLTLPLDVYALILTAGLSGLVLEYRVTANAEHVGAAIEHFAELMASLVVPAAKPRSHGEASSMKGHASGSRLPLERAGGAPPDPPDRSTGAPG